MMLPALARKLMPRTTVRPGAAAGQSVLRGRGWTSGSRGRRYGGRIDRVPAANLHVHTRWALDSGSVAGAGRATIAAANTQHCTATEYTDQRANKRAGLRWWALSQGLRRHKEGDGDRCPICRSGCFGPPGWWSKHCTGSAEIDAGIVVWYHRIIGPAGATRMQMKIVASS
jgi:hypothetical protein